MRISGKTLSLAAAFVAMVLMSWAPSHANNMVSATNPPCFQIGHADGCDVILTIDMNGNISLPAITGQPAYDGIEDQLVGVINNWTNTITSINLTGPNIFGFDFDGAFTGLASNDCNAAGTNTFGCGPGPNGSSGYEGPNTHFMITTSSTGTVFFDAGGIAPGGTAQFSLEESPTTGGFTAGGINQPVPEPGSLLLLGTGLASLAALRRRLRRGVDRT